MSLTSVSTAAPRRLCVTRLSRRGGRLGRGGVRRRCTSGGCSPRPVRSAWGQLGTTWNPLPPPVCRLTSVSGGAALGRCSFPLPPVVSGVVAVEGAATIPGDGSVPTETERAKPALP